MLPAIYFFSAQDFGSYRNIRLVNIPARQTTQYFIFPPRSAFDHLSSRPTRAPVNDVYLSPITFKNIRILKTKNP